MNTTKLTTAYEQAQRVAEFIQFNNIDISTTPMDLIVHQFLLAQLKVIGEAEQQVLELLA